MRQSFEEKVVANWRQGIKKIGGLSWKGRMVVAWSTGWEFADGLVITDKNGQQYRLTAIALRDELFNRLIAIGNHLWEAW